MKAWWDHHPLVPQLEDNTDKIEVEELTGRIPLLLRPLLRFGLKKFRVVENDIWGSPEFLAVSQNIRCFAHQMKEGDGGTRYNRLVGNCVPVSCHINFQPSYIEALFRCLIHLNVKDVSRDLFDYRYFYPDNAEVGRFACGAAREVAEILIRETYPDKFLAPEWYGAIISFRSNRSVVGSMIERSCLSYLSRFGVNHGELHFKPGLCKTYGPASLFLHLPPSEDCSTLFIPDNPRNEDIDAIHVRVSNENKTVYAIPIQITIRHRRKHSDSERGFYSRWSDWENHFQGYSLISKFLWIVETEDLVKEMDAQYRTTRSGIHVTMPAHERVVLPIEKLYKPLGEVLSSCRAPLTPPRITTHYESTSGEVGEGTSRNTQKGGVGPRPKRSRNDNPPGRKRVAQKARR
jgi:hypothetical protein